MSSVPQLTCRTAVPALVTFNPHPEWVFEVTQSGVTVSCSGLANSASRARLTGRGTLQTLSHWSNEPCAQEARLATGPSQVLPACTNLDLKSCGPSGLPPSEECPGHSSHGTHVTHSLWSLGVPPSLVSEDTALQGACQLPRRTASGLPVSLCARNN